MRFGIGTIVRGYVALALMVAGQLWGAEGDGQAMIILRSPDFADTQKTIAALEKEGVRPVHVIPPRVVIAFVPEDVEVRAAAIDNVVSIYRSTAPAIGPQEGTDLSMGVSMWNHLVSQRGTAPAGIPPGASPLVGDALEPPMPKVLPSSAGQEASSFPGYNSTSEFMIGKVVVGVIWPESNGNGENWSHSRQEQVFNEIGAGLDWLATEGGNAAKLKFYYNLRPGVPTQYEPITMNDEDDWVSDIFANMGYTTGNYIERARKYINALRNSFEMDWGYAIIVVDSYNDTDGRFADGQHFAWAHPGGPYVIMTYDNDNWGISYMNLVAAHETGHIFRAADEYCDPGYACCDFGYYGYLNIYNGNCEDNNPSSVSCIMRSNDDEICQWTKGQIGWQDTDGDGVPDTIDNVVNNTLNPSQTPMTEPVLTFTGTAEDVPCHSPTPPEVTINRISAVWYRVDGGAWADASAVDGKFDDNDVEDYSFTVVPGSGQHRIETQAYSTSGNGSAYAGRDVMLQLYGGGFGSQFFPYLISEVSHWRNLMIASPDWNKHFILTADLDLQGVALTPIGNSSQGFTGVFDGKGYVIRNADVNMPGSDYVGLFGFLQMNGQVKNLGVEDGEIIGRDFVGGLVGHNNYGIVSNCYWTGSVNGGGSIKVDVGGLVGYNNYGTISNCYSTGLVSGGEYTGGGIGGLVGHNFRGTISNCYSTASVNGTDYYVGGLVGSTYYGLISNCHSTGPVSGRQCVGGLMGSNSIGGTISNCYSAGSVSGSAEVGGLVGEHGTGTISGCYSTGSVNGQSWVGGLVGSTSTGSTISNCYSVASVNGQSWVGGLVGDNRGAISNCYSTGSVSGTGWYVGGLVGYNSKGTAISSFWDVDASDQTTSAVGTPKTTAEMQTESTFTGADWDFVNIWDICEGTNYPRLRWQIPSADRLCPDGVGFEDFSYLADGWLMEFEISDLAILCEQWLEGR